MFSTDDFQSWVKDNAIPFAAVMTKIEGREDDDLLRTYGFRGFPSLAVLDSSGDALTKSVPRDLPSMKRYVTAAGAFAKLDKLKEAGKDYDEQAYLMARIDLGEIEAAEAYAEIERLGLKGDAKKTAMQNAFIIEMGEVQKSVQRRGVSEEDMAEARGKVYAAFQAGKRLPAESSPQAFVDEMLIEAAQEHNDSDAFKYAYARVHESRKERVEMLEGYRPRYKDNEQMRGRLEEAITNAQKTLEELEATAKKLGVSN